MKKLTLYLLFVFLFFSFTAYGTEIYQDKQYYFNPSLRNYGTGKGVVVAILDTGVWQGHPDLVGSEWLNKNEVANNGKDDDKNGYVDDYYGWNFVDDNADLSPKGSHATSVASIIAAQTNGQGIAGIAPDAKIMSLIVCGESGCPTQSIIKAIYYATNQGANIINLSLGGQGYLGYSSEYDDAIKYAYYKGVIIVASAGNGDPESNQVIGQNLDLFPASPVSNDVEGINMILGVGATDYYYHKALSWSNYGKSVDVWAQGDDVITCTVPKFSNGHSYDILDGTSFSAPIISGYLALFKSKNFNLKNYEFIDAFKGNEVLSAPDISDKISEGRHCQIPSFSGTVAAGEKIVIPSQHLHADSVFYMANSSSGNEIVATPGIQILDANTFSLDTSKLNLSPGVYGLKSQNCAINWVSISITETSKPLNNPPTPTIASGDTLSDINILTNADIINKQLMTSDYNLNSPVLRQEVVGIGVKIAKLNLPPDYVCRNIFKDVSQSKPNTWACRSVELAGYKGFISTANPLFRPETNITRAEALAILFKAADISINDSGGISKFSDVNVKWQIDLVNAALEKGIIDSNEMFEPNKKATRKEIFNMASRLILLRK